MGGLFFGIIFMETVGASDVVKMSCEWWRNFISQIKWLVVWDGKLEEYQDCGKPFLAEKVTLNFVLSHLLAVISPEHRDFFLPPEICISAENKKNNRYFSWRRALYPATTTAPK